MAALLRAYNGHVRLDAVLGRLQTNTNGLEDFSLFEGREVPMEGARAYVCMDSACKLPVFDAPSLHAALSDQEDALR